MTPPSEKSSGGSFSTFGLGVAFGLVAAFLFGTEEGRKLVKKAVDSLPEKYKLPKTPAAMRQASAPFIRPEETPHHVYYPSEPLSPNEAPPPPPPAVHHTRPEPFRPQ